MTLERVRVDIRGATFPHSRSYSIGDILFDIRADHPVSLYESSGLSYFEERDGQRTPDLSLYISSFDKEAINWHDKPWRGRYYHNVGQIGRYGLLPHDYVKRFEPYMQEILSRDDRSCYLLNADYFFASFMSEKTAYLCYNSSVLEPANLRTMLMFFIRQFLEQFDAIMLHSSSVVIDDRALLFCGPRGIGKSTIVSLLHGLPSISDDYTLIRQRDGGFMAYSTPFGREEVPRSAKARAVVGAVYYLKQAERFQLRPLNPVEAIAHSVHSDNNLRHHLCYHARRYQFDFLAEMFKRIPVYELSFRKDRVDIEALRDSI
jgi:hypothetical protein